MQAMMQHERFSVRQVLVASLGYGIVKKPAYPFWVYIYDLKVDENWRRKKIATAMIRTLLGNVNSLEFPFTSLTVL